MSCWRPSTQLQSRCKLAAMAPHVVANNVDFLLSLPLMIKPKRHKCDLIRSTSSCWTFGNSHEVAVSGCSCKPRSPRLNCFSCISMEKSMWSMAGPSSSWRSSGYFLMFWSGENLVHDGEVTSKRGLRFRICSLALSFSAGRLRSYPTLRSMERSATSPLAMAASTTLGGLLSSAMALRSCGMLPKISTTSCGSSEPSYSVQYNERSPKALSRLLDSSALVVLLKVVSFSKSTSTM